MTPLVQLDDGGHRYGGQRVLENVHMRVFHGDRRGIAGRSGAGKSTLARILSLHLRPQTGTVSVKGVPWWPAPSGLQRMRSKIQLVFQDPASSFAPGWTVWQVAGEAAAIRGENRGRQRELADLLMRRVQLRESYAEKRAAELSGGERRRLAVARALGADPDVLILDESLSGLDALVQAELVDLLLQLNRETGVAVVTISHDLRLLSRIASRILILEAGRAAEEGRTEDVLGDPKSEAGQRLVAASYWKPRSLQ